MKQLYFANIPTIISTLLLIGFFSFFGIVISRNKQITHWGWLVVIVLLVGILMSAMSGTKDGVGTPIGVFPVGQFVFIAAAILGGLAVLAGILVLIIRKQEFWQFGFYAISTIIILKILLVEIARVVIYLKGQKMIEV